MSHDPNSIPPADREFNELYRAAQGTQSSHAPNNTKLNSVKNNPIETDGISIRHSDFFVEEVSKFIRVDDSSLYRSQITRAWVAFVGAKVGFSQEIMCNPNNFTWYVKPGYEHLIRIHSGNPASHPNKEDWNLSSNQYGAWQILIKNIAPCSNVDVTAYICCKFKDDFNETIGESKGYNTELTGTVQCEKNPVTVNLIPVGNGYGNAHAQRAYNNELEFTRSGGTIGQNYGDYNTATIDGRKFITLLDNCQDLLLQASLNGSASILNQITAVDCTWQKQLTNSDGSTEWVNISLNTGQDYRPATDQKFISTSNPTGNVGQLTKWFQGGTTSKDSKARLNVQGTHGSGSYRSVMSITADPEDPFTCVIESNYTSLAIVPRIPAFTVQGVGYGCAGDPVVITVNPNKYTRDPYNQQIATSDIRYEVMRLKDGGFDTLAGWTKENDGASFSWTINDTSTTASYYTVRALMVPNGSSTLTPGDEFLPGYGTRYATAKAEYSGFNRSKTQNTWGEWWNTAPYKRQTVPAIATPLVTEAVGKNMSHTRLRWKWNAVANPTGGTLTYQIRVIHHDQDAQWIEKAPWTDIGSTRTYTDDNALDSDNTTATNNAQTALQIRAKIVPPSTGLAAGDTVEGCYSETIAQSIITARPCSEIIPTMPVPATSASSNIAGNDKPIFNMNYTGKNWTIGFEESPLQANFVHIQVKNTGASESSYSDMTQTVADAKGIGSSVVTISGTKYIQYGNIHFFATNYTFGKGKTVRFTARTRWTDDSKSCYSPGRVASISMVNSNAVYSWSGSKPSSYSYGAHHGTTRATGKVNFASGFVLGSGTTADCTRYGFGIGCDNLPDWRVTGVHEQDSMVQLKYAGAGAAIKQLPQPTLGGRAKWPSVKLKIVGATNPSGATVKHNINSGSAYTPTAANQNDVVMNIKNTPPWVLSMQMTTPGRTYNNKEHVTNTIQRVSIPSADRKSASKTATNTYYENLTGSSRIISQRTSWS